jgi:hypothetical protein
MRKYNLSKKHSIIEILRRYAAHIRILLVVVPMISFSAISCNEGDPPREAYWQKKIDSLNARIVEMSNELALCRQNSLAGVEGKAVNRLRTKGLGNPESDMVSDINKHKDLLPQEKRCEFGSKFFVPHNGIHFLSSNVLMADFEDGLCGGNIILEFEVKDSAIINWKPLTYWMD